MEVFSFNSFNALHSGIQGVLAAHTKCSPDRIQIPSDTDQSNYWIYELMNILCYLDGELFEAGVLDSYICRCRSNPDHTKWIKSYELYVFFVFV